MRSRTSARSWNGRASAGVAPRDLGGDEHRVRAARSSTCASGRRASSPRSGSIRTKPARSETRELRSCGSCSPTRGRSRSARPGSTTTATSPRATGRPRRSALRRSSRRSSGSRWSSTRARPTRTRSPPSASSRRAAGRAALLLVVGAARAGARARLVRLLRRERHLPEGARAPLGRGACPCRAPARGDRRARTSRPSRCAASGTSRRFVMHTLAVLAEARGEDADVARSADRGERRRRSSASP